MNKTVKFFNPAKEYQLHRDEYLKAFDQVRSSGRLVGVNHQEILEFEKAFAEYVGVRYAVGTNSGTDSLYIALKAIGIKQEDEVILPSHTFVATAQVVAQLGATPILMDSFSKEELHEKVNANTKAIIIAHIAGEITVDIDLVKSFGLPIIEDACQALGATQNGKKAGSFGKVGAFSFYPAKILGGPGDGGMLVTDDEEGYKFASEYRNHWKSDYSKWGINSRLDVVLAKELLIKLKRIDKTLARREEIASMYDRMLPLKGLTTPYPEKGRVYQDYIINVGDKRDALYNFLKANGVESMKNTYNFPIPKLPKSVEYEASTLRLPCNEVLEDEEILYVIEKIKTFYEK